MTQWLPIDTYPYDGTWGIFRGGHVDCYDPPEIVIGHSCQRTVPLYVGDYDNLMAADRSAPELWEPELWEQRHVVEIVGAYPLKNAAPQGPGTNPPVTYADPTEWLPLSILDMLEDHHVTAVRLLL